MLHHHPPVIRSSGSTIGSKTAKNRNILRLQIDFGEAESLQQECFETFLMIF